jgi:hypothetical protein
MTSEGPTAARTRGNAVRTLLRGVEPTIRELWRRDPALFVVVAINTVLFGGFAAGIVLDPTTVNGEPAWLKPAKFAGSIALVSATLGWLGVHLPVSEQFRRRVSLIVGSGFMIEIALIGGQAARSVGSHFNRTTALDTAIGAVMGVTIVVVTCSIAVLVVRARNSAFDVHPAFATGILLGLGLFVVGAFQGGTMIALQSRTVETVGPTVPFVGWQIVGGFRLAHFVGLHALQTLPLAGYVAAGGRQGDGISCPRRIVVVVASGYALVFAATLALGIAPLVV